MWKRSDNADAPETDVATTYVNHMSSMHNCRLCEIDVTDTANIQRHDKH